jgi:integrase
MNGEKFDLMSVDFKDRRMLQREDTAGIIEGLALDVRKLIETSVSRTTKKNYLSDFGSFVRWCAQFSREWKPATVETSLLYLTSLKSSKKYSTIARASTSIHRIYQLAGMPSPIDSPEVKALLRGIRREIGIACEATKPLDWQQISKMVEAQLPSFLGLRNSALLSLGWCGAFRRSELVAIDIEDIEQIDEGIVVTIRRSKSDQEGTGQKVFIPSNPVSGRVCPVKLVNDLIVRMNRMTGPLFVRSARRIPDFYSDIASTDRLSSQSVTFIVKAAVREIGINPVHYSAHSLRRGFATHAARLGIPERLIGRQTRHRSMSVLRRYIDDGELTTNNPLTFIYRQRVGLSSSPPLEVSPNLRDSSSIPTAAAAVEKTSQAPPSQLPDFSYQK